MKLVGIYGNFVVLSEPKKAVEGNLGLICTSGQKFQIVNMCYTARIRCNVPYIYCTHMLTLLLNPPKNKEE
jgi:hypothetical protein